MPESTNDGGGRAARLVGRALALAVMLAALVHGAVRLALWASTGTTDWVLPAAAVLVAILVVILATGLLRGSSAFELALAALAWCFCAVGLSCLSPFPAAHHVGSGPSLAPVYLALALVSGLYALGRPRFLAPGSATVRACALLLFWATADAHLFQEPETATPLLAGGALLVLGAGTLRADRRLAVVVGLMLGWWALAAGLGDDWRLGVMAVAHLATGVVLAWALAGALDEHGVRRALAGVVAGVIVSCVLFGAAVVEMLPYNDLARILASRLRLFHMHPNATAPVFAAGVCLLAALLVGSRREPRAVPFPRWLLWASLIACLAGLVWTRSRGGAVGLLVGLLVTLAASAKLLPRRPLRWAGALGLTALLGAALFASPWASGLRAELAARTFTQSSLGQRYHLWHSAVAAVSDHPWFGLGPAQYYAHARYAAPSYYDGTNQGMHPHNILLAAAENAGLPGLLLFLALVAGFLELGRRRVLQALDLPRRRLWAGLLGAACAYLGADLLDLSQSGATMVPLLVWVGLGAFSASSTRAVPPAAGSHPRLAARVLASILLVPLAIMPLAGQAGLAWADALQRGGEAWRAARVCWAVRVAVHPWNPGAPLREVSCELALEHHQRALELMEAACRAAPSRLSRWSWYARMLLDDGRATEALDVLDRERSLDPRGPIAGAVTLSRARAHLALGHEQEARALLLEGLIQPGGDWSVLPTEELPPQPGDRPGSKRIAFRAAGEPPRRIPLSEILAELGRRSVELAGVDEVRGRRMLGIVFEGYLAQELPAEALEFVQAYLERVPVPIAATQGLEVRLLCELGDFEGAAEAYYESPFTEHPYLTAHYLNGIRYAPGPRERREFLERPFDLHGGGTTDLFFSAQDGAGVFDLEAERALRRGDPARAFDLLERALYHLHEPGSRLRLAALYLERAAALEQADETLLAALEVVLEEAGREPAGARDADRMLGWARALRDALTARGGEVPPGLASVLDASGEAGATFRRAWIRSAAGRGGERE